jgi:hypothetical protein
VSTSNSSFGAVNWTLFSSSPSSSGGAVGTGIDIGCNNTNLYLSGNFVGANTTLGGNTGSFSCAQTASGCAPLGFISEINGNNGVPIKLIPNSNAGSNSVDIRVGGCGNKNFDVWALGTVPAGGVFPNTVSVNQPSTYLVRFD